MSKLAWQANSFRTLQLERAELHTVTMTRRTIHTSHIQKWSATDTERLLSTFRRLTPTHSLIILLEQTLNSTKDSRRRLQLQRNRRYSTPNHISSSTRNEIEIEGMKRMFSSVLAERCRLQNPRARRNCLPRFSQPRIRHRPCRYKKCNWTVKLNPAASEWSGSKPWTQSDF